MNQCELDPGDSTIQSVLEIRDKYYKENGKNVFFKNRQKAECAQEIQQSILLEDLMRKTFWIVPNTNRVYFDYTVFKLYAIPENYGRIVDEILKLYSKSIDTYGTFEVHMNIDTFTVSAAQRYTDVIRLFCQESMVREERFSVLLDRFYLYNIPNMIDHITSVLMPFLPPEVQSKLVLFKRSAESTDMLRSILSGN